MFCRVYANDLNPYGGMISHWTKRVRSGAVTGLGIGSFFSVWIALIWLIRGEVVVRGHEIVPLHGILVYEIGCLLGGSLVGLCLPLLRTVPGAVLIGVFGTMPVIAGFIGSIYGFQLWQWPQLPGVILTSTLLGGPIGLIVREATGMDLPQR